MNPVRLEDCHTKEELLERLIDQFGPDIKRLAYTYVKDWPTAEDITQEIFISCYKKIDDFRGESSYKTWLYKIAINKCKDFYRSKWYRFVTPFDNVIEKLKGGNLSIEEQVILKEEDYLLSQQVLSLPQKYREMIILYYYEELKISEIEELTGIKQETIKTRLRRAKQQLSKEWRGLING
jgi:RNA polymerase sigma-70 factor (ECF subfamily)